MWNYRIVRYADGTGYGLHEVHYSLDGKETSMTTRPARFQGDSAEELRSLVTTAHMDAIRRPVFQEPVEWSIQANLAAAFDSTLADNPRLGVLREIELAATLLRQTGGEIQLGTALQLERFVGRIKEVLE